MTLGEADSFARAVMPKYRGAEIPAPSKARHGNFITSVGIAAIFAPARIVIAL